MSQDLETFPSVIERKHVIKRYRREVDGEQLWVVEIWPPKALKPKLTVTDRVATHTLDDVTAAAKRYVAAFIKAGGRIPVDELGTSASFGGKGLDGLNVRSASGKPQWCEKHWKPVVDGAMAGTHNAIAAGIYLTSVFLQKIKSDGALRADQNNPYTVEMLRDSYSPFCCWLGDEVVGRIMEASSVEALEKSGALKELERQLRKR